MFLKYYLVAYQTWENGLVIGSLIIPLFKYPSIDLISAEVLKAEASVTNPSNIGILAISVLSEDDYKSLVNK